MDYSRKRLTTVLLILLIIGIHLVYLLHTHFIDWPEMIFYPWLLSKGQVFYRDAILSFLPGTYFLMYPFYKILGFTHGTERIISYILILATDVVLFRLVFSLVKNIWIAAGSVGFYVFWLPIFSGNSLWCETFLTPIYLATFSSGLSYIHKPHHRKAITIGLFLALASMIKQTSYTTLIFVVFFLLLTQKHTRESIKNTFLIAGFPLVVNVLLWLYYASYGAGSNLFQWSYGVLPFLTRHESYYPLLPSRSDILLLLPAFIPFISVLLASWKKREMWFLVLWSVILVGAAFPRFGAFRLLPVVAFASVTLGILLARLLRVKQLLPHVVILFLLLLVAIGSARSFRIYKTIRDPMQPEFFDSQYNALISYIHAHVDKPFYIMGNYDYVYLGVEQTPTVLPWTPLTPWNSQIPGVQTGLAEALERQQTPYILYIPFHPDKGWYENYRPEILESYVFSHYKKIDSLPLPGGILLERNTL